MNATAEIASRFETTTVGVNNEFNLIDWATGIQIFSGIVSGYNVAVPNSARHSGVRAIKNVATLDEAYAYAAEITPRAAAKMARLHAEALRANATR